VQGYAEQSVTCPGWNQQFAVGIWSIGACLVTDLRNENIHVSVIDDPVNAPKDSREVERISARI
jgi:hypothetical protein